MYQLKNTPFASLVNIIDANYSPVAHVTGGTYGYHLWERGIDGDDLIAEVTGYEHGLTVWEAYATP